MTAIPDHRERPSDALVRIGEEFDAGTFDVRQANRRITVDWITRAGRGCG
jgi:hypothetical protein